MSKVKGEILLDQELIDDLESKGVCSECGEKSEVEVDQKNGYCEPCGTNTVTSMALLFGLV